MFRVIFSDYIYRDYIYRLCKMNCMSYLQHHVKYARWALFRRVCSGCIINLKRKKIVVFCTASMSWNSGTQLAQLSA